jgi:hypothetical protein
MATSAGEVDATVFLDVKFVPLGGETVTHNQQEEYLVGDCVNVIESVRMAGARFTYARAQVIHRLLTSTCNHALNCERASHE